MVQPPLKPVALNPKPDDRELDAKRLALHAQSPALVTTDEILLGMQMGNIILAAALGLLTRTER